MKCPFCNQPDSKVIDSRPAEEGTVVRRRRECVECERRFTTYEKVEGIPLVVIKKNGDRQTYDKNKILKGVLRACEKRPISTLRIEEAMDRIEYRLLSEYDKEIPSNNIGEIVMDELKKLDEVAYVRFASVYRQFKDINTFMDELKTMLDDKELQ